MTRLFILFLFLLVGVLPATVVASPLNAPAPCQGEEEEEQEPVEREAPKVELRELLPTAPGAAPPGRVPPERGAAPARAARVFPQGRQRPGPDLPLRT
ncbi:MAG: hypothetical protein AB7N76_18925 [Planctomycetota bacterium]